MKRKLCLLFLITANSFGYGFFDYPINSEEINRNYNLYEFSTQESEFTQKKLKNYIYSQTKKYHTEEWSHRLSESILLASEVYQIGADSLTALIEVESSYHQKAQSNTGAVGLTQFTWPGVVEILEQFRIITNSWSFKNESSIEKSITWIEIYDDYQLKSNFHFPPFTDFNNSLSGLSKSQKVYKVKRMLNKYPEMAVLFSAMYLKILLKQAWGSRDYERISAIQPNKFVNQLDENYRKAFLNYNGDTKKNYLGNCRNRVKMDTGNVEERFCYSYKVLNIAKRIRRSLIDAEGNKEYLEEIFKEEAREESLEKLNLNIAVPVMKRDATYVAPIKFFDKKLQAPATK